MQRYTTGGFNSNVDGTKWMNGLANKGWVLHSHSVSRGQYTITYHYVMENTNWEPPNEEKEPNTSDNFPPPKNT